MKKYLIILILAIGIILAVRVAEEKEVPVFSSIVKEMGYDDVFEKPYEVVRLTIPKEFSTVWENYNNLLKEKGYDLIPYKGKKCTRYTYLIPSQNARANILVYEGEIIGGDISSITLDGVMLPIEKNN